MLVLTKAQLQTLEATSREFARLVEADRRLQASRAKLSGRLAHLLQNYGLEPGEGLAAGGLTVWYEERSPGRIALGHVVTPDVEVATEEF